MQIFTQTEHKVLLSVPNQQALDSWNTSWAPPMSRSGYCLVHSNEDFGVLGDFGDLRDSGISGKQRLHKLMWLGIERGLITWPQVTIGEGNSDQVNYAREGSFGVQEAARIINEKALSKACIHKENKLKTCPMKQRQYIYRRDGSY